MSGSGAGRRPGGPVLRGPLLRGSLLRGRLPGGPVLRGGGRVLVCLLVAAAALVAVPAPHALAPAPVSDRHDLAVLARAAGYTVLAPRGLPPSWTPVDSGVAIGGANGPGTATWHLGYLTPSRTLASVQESDASAAVFVRRMTNSGTRQAPVRLAGRSWNASAVAGRGQRSLYATRAGVTVVVTGNASWADLRTLAASLRPRPRR